MKIDILGSGSIGAKNMSACTMIDGRILLDVPNEIVKYMKHLGLSVLNLDTDLLRIYMDIIFLIYHFCY